MWGNLGQVGWKWEKLSWGIDIDSPSRLRAAGRAGIFDLVHISQLRFNDGHIISTVLTHDLDIQVDFDIPQLL